MSGFAFSISFPGFYFVRMTPVFLLCLLGFALVHMFKMIRMYLIVMEKNVPFKRFLAAYFRTTLVNLIIPYKIGEIYRVAVFSRITGVFNVGLFSVLVDRFFDTLALLIILLPYQIFSGRGISASVAVLTVFLMLLIFAYACFPSSYKYLNKYIITSRTSKSSMMVLRVLELVNECYMYVKELILGRYGLLMLFSFGAWIVEILVLMGIARTIGFGFSASEFGDYISSIMSAGTTRLSLLYTIISAVIIGIACIISTCIYLSGKGKENK